MVRKKAPPFPANILMKFFRAAAAELGRKNLDVVLQKAGLASDQANSMVLNQLNDLTAGEAYASLQQAIRAYYGRGARGLLLRVGKNLWSRMLDDFSLKEKVLSWIIRILPIELRIKFTLELISRLLSVNSADMSIHSLDLDWMLVDHASPTTHGQVSDKAVCFVTLGVIQEALYWAARKEYDIEEIACRAAGAQKCEFKIYSRT
ncbi:MAG: hypothetical protein JXA13_05205 [Anaerolineales bacterium]|nr:hypothetical protein [Anaerolineales bacterium]